MAGHSAICAAHAKDIMEFQKHTFENGLTVIGELNPDARSVALGYFVKTGSRDETPAVAGVSHFLEHMMFKGDDRLLSWDINAEFDAIGARYNAFTSEEITAYHGAVMPEYRERLLKLLTAMMRPSLRQSDFDVEKNVILEEIEMYKDRPNFAVFDELRPAYFAGHPLGNSILGSSESISNLTRDAMQAYFEQRYAPNNLILGVAGKYDWEATLEHVNALTAHWTSAQVGRQYPVLQHTPQTKVLENHKWGRAHIALMAPGYSSQDSRRHAAGVLSLILGDGENSRLYWALVDKGMCETASLDHAGEDGLGHFSGYVTCDPKDAREALRVYRQVLTVAQSHGVAAQELERAKRKVAVALVLRAETPYSRLFSLGLEYVDTQTYRSLQDTVNEIRAVTIEDVNAILEDRPFDHLTVVGLGPFSSLD
jgi:predicted Zn-dependent peptidase